MKYELGLVIYPGIDPRLSDHEPSKWFSDRVTIGRGRDVDVRVRHSAVSRQHCEIVPSQDGNWYVEDNASLNGTFVTSPTGEKRDVRSAPVRLSNGDTLHVAGVPVLVFLEQK